MAELHKGRPQIDLSIAEFFAEVYKNVALGLCVAGSVAWFTMYTRSALFLAQLPCYLACVAVCIGMIQHLVRNIASMTFTQARLWYLGITGIEGMMLAPIGMIYTGESIATIFLITSVVFLVASQYGAATGENLTKAHGVVRTILLGCSVVLLFHLVLYAFGLISVQYVDKLHLLVCLIIAIMAPICIAGTSQNLAEFYYRNPGSLQKIAVAGALHLFLDFLNLFLALLRLFGTRRRDE